MRRLITIVLILLGSLSLADAATLEFSGNRTLSKSEIRKAIGSRLPADSISVRVESLYRKMGYYDVAVAIDSLSAGIIKINIREGEPTRIARIDIHIMPPDSTLDFEIAKREIAGQVASERTFDDFADDLIGRLAEIGMPFASAHWRDFRFVSDHRIAAALHINAGPKVYIADIKFRGVRRTRAHQIKQVANLSRGQRYAESKVRQSEIAIGRMPYVEIDRPFELQPLGNGDSANIIYNLRELPSTRFDGAGGLVSARNKTTFVGRLNIEFGDILGSGRAFSVLWNKKDRLSSELRLSYLEPFLLKSRFNLALTAFQIDRDTLYIETGGSVGFTHAFGGGLDGGLSLTILRTQPEDSSLVASSTSRIVTLRLGYINTDFDENPRRGYDLMTEVEHKYRSNPTHPSDKKVGVDTLDLSYGSVGPTQVSSAGLWAGYYISPWRHLTLALKLQAWGIVANDGTIPVDELRYLGGPDDLRGYISNQIPAYRYALATVEPRLLSGRYSRMYLFTDLAEIKSFQESKYRFQAGYGLGLAAPSTLGQFKVEIAWTRSGFPKDAVLNFGLAGRF